MPVAGCIRPFRINTQWGEKTKKRPLHLSEEELSSEGRNRHDRTDVRRYDVKDG